MYNRVDEKLILNYLQSAKNSTKNCTNKAGGDFYESNSLRFTNRTKISCK